MNKQHDPSVDEIGRPRLMQSRESPDAAELKPLQGAAAAASTAMAAAASDAETAEKSPPSCSSALPEEDRGDGGEHGEDESSELRRLLLPDPRDLPLTPPSAVESNFVTYFATDFLKPGHDQYIHRHANGLCVVGLAPSHVALKEEGGVTAVDFNVGRSDRSEMKVTGKRKKNAQHFEPNSALCKVCTNGNFYIVRCCVKGSLLEVNDRLIKQPELLNSSADREGYIAIVMPKPAEWVKLKDSFLSAEDHKKLRGLS